MKSCSICTQYAPIPPAEHPNRNSTYFSSSLSFATSNVSSHPTSIRILTPPSSSRIDCEADDSDWAPRREQKVNMLLTVAKISASMTGRFRIASYLYLSRRVQRSKLECAWWSSLLVGLLVDNDVVERKTIQIAPCRSPRIVLAKPAAPRISFQM